MCKVNEPIQSCHDALGFIVPPAPTFMYESLHSIAAEHVSKYCTTRVNWTDTLSYNLYYILQYMLSNAHYHTIYWQVYTHCAASRIIMAAATELTLPT